MTVASCLLRHNEQTKDDEERERMAAAMAAAVARRQQLTASGPIRMPGQDRLPGASAGCLTTSYSSLQGLACVRSRGAVGTKLLTTTPGDVGTALTLEPA